MFSPLSICSPANAIVGGSIMPRNIEFFYSCNRLKVAISRAHCLSVILQTRSLEIPCTTIDQMQLVNTLCWVKHYAGNLSCEQYIVRSTLEFDVDTINPWEAPRPRVRRSHEQIH